VSLHDAGASEALRRVRDCCKFGCHPDERLSAATVAGGAIGTLITTRAPPAER
jgi:hypothetical protein